MISTVLPTPAPPNMPALPPLGSGANRSTTFMPVVKTSYSVRCSSTDGPRAWMGRMGTSPPDSSAIGGRRSMGWPSTLIMRPRTASPTGTIIGPPSARASDPRARPAVALKAMPRTLVCERCCCTSMTIWPLGPAMCTASLMPGRPPANSMSTTEPRTPTTRPVIAKGNTPSEHTTPVCQRARRQPLPNDTGRQPKCKRGGRARPRTAEEAHGDAGEPALTPARPTAPAPPSKQKT